MGKIIALTSALILIAIAHGSATAAPITVPPPFHLPVFQSFTIYDSGFQSSPIDLEVNAASCSSLLACVFNNSVGAVNLPITLFLDYVYPPFSPPACAGQGGVVAVTLLTFTVNSSSANCENLPTNIVPPCLRVATQGSATSYSVELLCH